MAETTSTIWATLGQIIMLLSAGAILLILEQIRQKALEWLKTRRLHPIARAVRANKNVHTQLVELRTLTDADRAYVFLFHNGQHFSNKNPVWRLSCTQESCRTGISHEIEHSQGILSSTIWDGIAPLFGDVTIGITPIEAENGKAFMVKVEDLNDTYFRRFMISRGIQTAVISAIIDHRKEVVGFLAVNYCLDNVADMNQVGCEVVKFASSIHFALTEE